MNSEIHLPAAELKVALAGLAKVVPKNGIPALGSVRCTREQSGKITLRATDLESSLTYRAKETQAGPVADFLVPFGPFFTSVRRAAAKERIGVSPQSKGSVLLRSFLGSIALEELLSASPVEDWPQAVKIEGKPVTLDWVFKSALREALDCASTTEVKLALSGAFVDLQDPAAHYIVASDRQHLYAANSLKLELPRSIIIPNHRFILWPVFHEDGPWSVVIEPAHRPDEHALLQIASAHWTLTVQPIEGAYPDWKAVLPSEDQAHTRIEIPRQTRMQMETFIPRLPGGDSKDDAPISLRVQNGCLVIGSRPEPGGAWVMVPLPEAKVTGRPVEMSLKRVHLLKALRLGVEEIEIISEEEPVECRAPGKLLIIQPLVPEPERPPAASQAEEPPQPEPEPEAIQQSSGEEVQFVEERGEETGDDPFGSVPESDPSSESDQTEAAEAG